MVCPLALWMSMSVAAVQSVTYASVHEELTKSNPDFDISALQPLKHEVMTSKLVKLGDDHLSLQESDITINGIESNALMPLSAFNNLRREALQEYIRSSNATL